MKTIKFLPAAVALLAGLVIPALAHAQGKIRIAIWDFDNNAERHWWFYNDLGPAARNHIDTAFSENSVLSEKFSVIEREKLEMVMKEQGLATSGALDPQTAAQVGKVLGIKYILTGGIDRFSINTTKGKVGWKVGGSMTKAEAKISMRFIDTTTAERIVAISAEGDVKKGGGFIKGTSLSHDDEWGIASEAVEKAALAVVKELVDGGHLDRIGGGGGASSGSEGKVIKVDGSKAWINMGSTFGIKVGDQFEIVEQGEALIDPDTGMSLGADEKSVGTGKVIEVQDRFSIIQVTGSAKAKAVVRKQ